MGLVKEPDWTEINPRSHPWINENWGEITDGNEDHYRDRVLFTPKGACWPLLSVGLNAWTMSGYDKGRQRLSFESSIKSGAEEWWLEGYGVPPALLPRVRELINATMDRLLAAPQVPPPRPPLHLGQG